jgi:hypothetical protein
MLVTVIDAELYSPLSRLVGAVVLPHDLAYGESTWAGVNVVLEGVPVPKLLTAATRNW